MQSSGDIAENIRECLGRQAGGGVRGEGRLLPCKFLLVLQCYKKASQSGAKKIIRVFMEAPHDA